MNDNQNIIAGHESPVRKMVSESQGLKYESIQTLEEAKKIPNAYLIMEGDDGGQIYLVCPTEIIRITENLLKKLLQDLDQRAWKDSSMTGLYYEVHEPGTGISGGMGGGRAERDLWVHEKFNSIKNKIQEVINGTVESLD